MKIRFLMILALVCLFEKASSQMAYKLGLTFRQPQSIKSPGIVTGLDFKKNSLQLSYSHFWHTPVPNQTVNSLDLKSDGFYQAGLSYLRKISIKKLSVNIGAGLSLVNGPRYFLVDYYATGGYGIYRVEDGLTPTLTLNMEVAYKSIFLLTEYNMQVKSILMGVGVRIYFKKASHD